MFSVELFSALSLSQKMVKLNKLIQGILTAANFVKINF